MPNLKMFIAIVVCVFVLVVGLEWLPKQVISHPQPLVTEQSLKTPSLEDTAMSEKERHTQDIMGVSVVGYFLLLSVLLYAKIRLQRPHE